MKTVLFILGTRAEAIKMAPVIRAFSKDCTFRNKVCVTGQHNELLNQVLEERGIVPDYNLNLMRPNQSLAYLTSSIIEGVSEILNKIQPDLVIVQGDTTSAMAAGLAGFYHGCRVGHIEAGLRTYDTAIPFPEEMNRQTLGSIATYHFAPTQIAYQNLVSEKVNPENIFMVGNTSVDALYQKLESLKGNEPKKLTELISQVNPKNRIVVATTHRRENRGDDLDNICSALQSISQLERVQIIVPLHPNPETKNIITSHLKDYSNIMLIDALDHLTLIGLLQKSKIVITDSGGIQEETPYLGLPTIVTRINTERQEGCITNNSILTGSNQEKIVTEVKRLINDDNYYKSRSEVSEPYGDGQTSNRILDIIKDQLL